MTRKKIRKKLVFCEFFDGALRSFLSSLKEKLGRAIYMMYTVILTLDYLMSKT